MRRTVLSLLAAVPLALGGLIAVTAPASAADTDVEINEIESSDGFPDDWVELKNTAAAPVDIGGWVVKDDGEATTSDRSRPRPRWRRAPATPSTCGARRRRPGAALRRDGAALIDSVTWASPRRRTAPGRAAPTAAGTFVDGPGGTKGAPNVCRTDAAWPGGDRR